MPLLKESGTFIVAEVGLAHMGRVALAEWFIDNLGQANAVKFQVYDTDALIDMDRDPERYNRFKERELTFDEVVYLKGYAESKGLKWFASAHTLDWLHRLAEMDVFAYKIGSGERDNSLLTDFAVNSEKPTLISTGLRNHFQAVATITRFQKKNVVFMHCVTEYPVKNPNLGFIPTMKEVISTNALNVMHSKRASAPLLSEVGYSCHAVGPYYCALAVAMGATVIEKHVKHPESVGQDCAGALYPPEFDEMVEEIRDVEDILGSSDREYHEGERENEAWAIRDPKDGKRPFVQ